MAADPLAQLDHEGSRPYQRLVVYANLGPSRSLKKAAAECNVSESCLRSHARDFSWATRVAAFDRQQLGTIAYRAAQDSTEAHLAALGAYRDQQLHQSEVLTEAAEALLGAAMRTLASLKAKNLDLPPNTVSAAMTTAAKLLELSGNQVAGVLAVEELLGAMGDTDGLPE